MAFVPSVASRLLWSILFLASIWCIESGRFKSSNSSFSIEAGGPKFKVKGFKPRTKGRLRGASGVGTEGGNRLEVHGQVATITAVCLLPFPALELDATLCPSDCPLLRYDKTLMCHWKCISEAACAAEHSMVMDMETGFCSVCTVVGCDQCAETSQTCLKCHDGFGLKENGECENHSTQYWTWLGPFAMGLVGILLLYVIILAWRPVTNATGLEWGMRHRSRAKAREDCPPHSFYPLLMSLSDVYTMAGGMGTLLHFSWQRMMLWWVFFVMMVYGGVNYWNNMLMPADLLAGAPPHDEAIGQCMGRHTQDMNILEHERIHYLWGTGIVYVVTTIGVIFWAIRQRMKYRAFDVVTTSLKDFALEVSGFPKESEGAKPQEGKRLEEEYTKFFENTWGATVVLGTTIAWDFDEKEDDIMGMVSKYLDAIEQDSISEEAERDASDLPTHSASCYPANLLPEESGVQAAPEPNIVEKGMRKVDALLLGRDPWESMPGTSPSREKMSLTPDKDDALEAIAAMETTGYAFVVFKSEADRDHAMMTKLPKFRGEHAVVVKVPKGEPECVTWPSYSTTEDALLKRVVVGVGWMCVVIAVWAVCFWSPYTLYIITWSNTPGQSQGKVVQATLLGLMITVGNQVVYAACDILADRAKFRCRDDRDMFYVALYTFSVVINTILDMWLVTWMALGWRHDSHQDPSTLVRNPSMQHALFVQLVFYLWPAALLIPFCVEPLVISVGPYYFGKWFVRSNAGVMNWEAEQWLTPPPFDLNRYGDVLINVILVTCCLFLTSTNIWWIFCMLLISNIFIFVWDDYRFKRICQHTHFATQDVDILSQYILAIPCATIAGAFMFKFSGGQALVRSWGHMDAFFLDHPELWRDVIMAFVTHLCIHWAILAWFVPMLVHRATTTAESSTPRGQDEDISMSMSGTVEASKAGTSFRGMEYVDCAQRIACNWFNSNPVHCLRSLYLYEQTPPHVFYKHGKEHLHKRNYEDPKALIVYEAGSYHKEKSFAEELRDELAQKGKDFKSEASRLHSRMRTTTHPDSPDDSPRQQAARALAQQTAQHTAAAEDKKT